MVIDIQRVRAIVILILQAAVKVFARRGYFNAKVADIAREAGIADGTVYLYFKSKDEVLHSVFNRAMEEANPDYVVADAGSSDPGPVYLGEDTTMGHFAREELELFLTASRKKGIPLVIGSAGDTGKFVTPGANAFRYANA